MSWCPEVLCNPSHFDCLDYRVCCVDVDVVRMMRYFLSTILDYASILIDIRVCCVHDAYGYGDDGDDGG